MRTTQNRQLPPLSFFREHAKMTIGGFLAFAVVMYFLLPLVWQVRPTNTILDRYAESQIRVGDSQGTVDSLSAKKLNTTTADGETVVQYQSKKSPRLQFQFVLNSRGRVVEAEYPISLQEKVTLSQIGNLLPSSNPTEYWDTNGSNTKLRIYPQEGFALSYHEVTESVYTLYQFPSGNMDSFIARNSEFVLTKPEEAEHAEFSEPGFGDSFDTSVEIPNLDSDRVATESPQITPVNDNFMFR
jgi:hypothetical protein